MNVQSITLDLSKAIMAGQIVRMGQGDSEGTTIQATILDNSAIPSLTGMSARFYMRMPDGAHYVRDVNCTISGNVITYVVNEEHCCAVAGYTDEAYFEVVDGTNEYSTSRFRVKIERAAHEGAVPTESWDNAVDELIERGSEQLAEFGEAESGRASAEESRVAAEQGRVTAETARASAETARASAETARASAETARATAETARASAETSRASAEQGRVTADETRTTQQTANNSAQTANNTAQGLNDAAQTANDTAQAQNDLDQQRNNEAAASGYSVVLTTGQYDPTTGVPTISAETEKRMVLTPNPDQSDTTNKMLEWKGVQDTNNTWRWELVGGTGTRLEPATTEQANSMWSDPQQTVTSTNVPDASWMSYYTTKVRTWLASHFLAIGGIAQVAQVISSGEVQATVSNVIHKLSEKLNTADYRKALKWGEVSDEWLWGETGQTPSTQGTAYTDNLSLIKPGIETTISVDDFNDNADAIDDAFGDVVASIADVESVTATSNHSMGDYFMLGGVLMRATSAIATGETITTNNATPATVQSQIDTLRDSVDKIYFFKASEVHFGTTTDKPFILQINSSETGDVFNLQVNKSSKYIELVENGTIVARWTGV